MIELASEKMAMDTFIHGLTNFGAYFALSILFLVVFKVIYLFVTPYDEWKLIKDNKNIAAGIALGGAIIGYSIAIAGAASNSVGLTDFALWGLVALVAQILGFTVLRLIVMPKLVQRIESNEVAAATIVASVSIAIGLMNSACMSY
ncbi:MULTISPECIES: DUF350 domain-containing protein [Vibrio]